MKKYLIPLRVLVLTIFYAISTVLPVLSQTTDSPELSVSVSVIFPDTGGTPQTALKPNDQFSIRIEAPGMGISQVSVNFDELGIGLEPVSNSDTGIFETMAHLLPYRTSGLKHYTVMFRDSIGTQHDITKAVQVDSDAPTGQVTAAFSKTQGAYSVHVSGSTDGTGSDTRVVDAFTYAIDTNGLRVSAEHLEDLSQLHTPLSFSFQMPIQVPDQTWSEIGYAITIRDAANNEANIYSEATPVASIQSAPLINHALSGSIAIPVSAETGGDIPSGVWIPHTLINSLPEGNYYAVVFFEGLGGCPTNNFLINAFHKGLWGADLASGRPYPKAMSTGGGGCMQYFHIDPTKGDGWYWGALDPNNATNAIADSAGVPAFAICDDLATCYGIAPRTDVTSPPPVPAEPSNSSILFLPGIKGSRLYENNPLCLIPSLGCDIPLWLPLGDIATPELFMDTLGKSVRNVYAKENDVMRDAYGMNFYKTFAQKMDEASSSGKYGKGWSWKSIAYDWRMSLLDIVHNGSVFKDRIYYEDPTNTPYIEQALRTLASSSPTGKVTIIAHSNGGLVAKALIQELGDAEAARLIDSVVMVGVPQSGVPRAVGALLYGDSEGIPGTGRFPNLIMSAAHAREFALNAPMAYHLLPSASYMANKNESYPLIHFEDTPLLAHDRTLYGDTIDTADELTQFLLGDVGTRNAPPVSDLTLPAVARKNLLTEAKNTHDLLDAWTPPTGIEVYEVAGYGVDTISGFDMYEAPSKSSVKKMSYRPLFTQDGDGTVPVTSSLMMNEGTHVHTDWVDMSHLSTGASYTHGNMFEAPEIEQVIQNILGRTSQPVVISAAGMESGEPHKRISFYVHSSSASMSAIDSAGNRTEVRTDGTGSENIPGSTSGTVGEVSYITLPGNSSYSLVITGNAAGAFTLDMEDRTGDMVTATGTVAEVPTTALTVATLTVQNSITQSSTLSIDEDGDGKIDYSATSQPGTVVFPSLVKVPEQTYISTPPIITNSVTNSSITNRSTQTLSSPLGFSTTSAVKVASIASTSTGIITTTAVTTQSNSPQVAGTSTSRELVFTKPDTSEEPLSWWVRIKRFLRKIAHRLLGG
ncbi:MAG: hypothetical protein JWL75_292 [Parcubacteria group bacterium]|nr:hypothetical protein [Parcubacteria group bacterium]